MYCILCCKFPTLYFYFLQQCKVCFFKLLIQQVRTWLCFVSASMQLNIVNILKADDKNVTAAASLGRKLCCHAQNVDDNRALTIKNRLNIRCYSLQLVPAIANQVKRKKAWIKKNS